MFTESHFYFKLLAKQIRYSQKHKSSIIKSYKRIINEKTKNKKTIRTKHSIVIEVVKGQ